jgi:hypothetical protein
LHSGSKQQVSGNCPASAERLPYFLIKNEKKMETINKIAFSGAVRVAAVALVILCAALFAGCSSSPVDKSISRIEKAIEKVEKNKSKMTESDWQVFIAEIQEPYKVLDAAIKEDKVGAMKKIKIVAVTAKLMLIVGEAGFGSAEAFETLMNASKEKQKTEDK